MVLFILFKYNILVGKWSVSGKAAASDLSVSSPLLNLTSSPKPADFTRQLPHMKTETILMEDYLQRAWFDLCAV